MRDAGREHQSARAFRERNGSRKHSHRAQSFPHERRGRNCIASFEKRFRTRQQIRGNGQEKRGFHSLKSFAPATIKDERTRICWQSGVFLDFSRHEKSFAHRGFRICRAQRACGTAKTLRHFVARARRGQRNPADLAAGVPAALVFVSTTPCREHHSRDKFLLLSRER